MIVCKNCGHQNEDGADFCGNCGKFLEWHGERVAVAQAEPEPEPPAAPPPPPEPAHVGFMDRVKQAVGIEEAPPQQLETSAATPAPVTSPQAPQAAAQAPAATSTPAAAAYTAASAPGTMRPVPLSSAAPSAPAAPASAPAYQPKPAETAAERQPVLAGVGSPAAQTPSAAPPAQEPASQKPAYQEPASQKPTYAAPKPARPARTAFAPPTHKAGPNDVYCGQCGEVNDKTRHFCRRCGNSLDEAIAVQLPWYRRFWNRMFHRQYAAGYRHRRIGRPNVMGGVWRIVRLAILALLVVFVAAFALIPSFRSSVIDRGTRIVTPWRMQLFPHYDPAHATGASASSSIAGHPPTLTIDGFSNTYWAAAPTDAHPVLTIVFPSPTDLGDIGITSGASGTAPSDQYLAQPRPHVVHLVFSDGTSQDVSLSDQAKTQFFTLNAKHVTSVQLQVQSVYVTSGPSPSSVAITEVEFRVRD